MLYKSRLHRHCIMQASPHEIHDQGNRIPTLFLFLLIHEMMHMITTKGQALCVTISELPETVASSLKATATSLKISTDGLIPIGFHGDASPNQKTSRSCALVGTYSGKLDPTGCCSLPSQRSTCVHVDVLGDAQSMQS